MIRRLEDVLNGVSDALSRMEIERETAIASSRKAIRLSKNVIHAIHNGEDCTSALEDMRRTVASLDRSQNASMDAMMEYSEAEILLAIVEGRDIPSPDDLGIDEGAWLMGMADTIGELRRAILTRLMESDLESARRLFDSMEALCEGLMVFDVPDAILPIRRKQDVARSLLERTRSDILNATLTFGR